MTWEQRIIEAGYRALAKQHHPDKGGQAADMVALNAARDRLVEFGNRVSGIGDGQAAANPESRAADPDPRTESRAWGTPLKPQRDESVELMLGIFVMDKLRKMGIDPTAFVQAAQEGQAFWKEGRGDKIADLIVDLVGRFVGPQRRRPRGR